MIWLMRLLRRRSSRSGLTSLCSLREIFAVRDRCPVLVGRACGVMVGILMGWDGLGYVHRLGRKIP
jgi:hypothetical protein